MTPRSTDEPIVGQWVHVVTWAPARASLACLPAGVLDVAEGPDHETYSRIRARILAESRAIGAVGAFDREAWVDYDPSGALGVGWHPLAPDCRAILGMATRVMEGGGTE